VVAKQTPEEEWPTPRSSEADDVATGVVTHLTGKVGPTPGDDDDGGKPGCVPPSQGGRARPPGVNDEEATGVAKQTFGKDGSTPESSQGNDVAPGVVTHITDVNDDDEATGVVKQNSSKAGSTPECSEGVATGVVTDINGKAGSPPGEEDGGGKPGCTPPSKGGRARPSSANDVGATGVAKQTSGNAGSTPECPEGDDDVAAGVVTRINGNAWSTPGEEGAGGKPGCIPPSQGGRARPPDVIGDEATGVAKLTSGKAGPTPVCPGGDDGATGVVTHINGKADSTRGEEDDGGKPGCTPPSRGERARPPSVTEVGATGVAKQTAGKVGSTPECPEGDDVATGVITHII